MLRATARLGDRTLFKRQGTEKGFITSFFVLSCFFCFGVGVSCPRLF